MVTHPDDGHGGADVAQEERAEAALRERGALGHGPPRPRPPGPRSRSDVLRVVQNLPHRQVAPQRVQPVHGVRHLVTVRLQPAKRGAHA